MGTVGRGIDERAHGRAAGRLAVGQHRSRPRPLALLPDPVAPGPRPHLDGGPRHPVPGDRDSLPQHPPRDPGDRDDEQHRDRSRTAGPRDDVRAARNHHQADDVGLRDDHPTPPPPRAPPPNPTPPPPGTPTRAPATSTGPTAETSGPVETTRPEVTTNG